MPNSTRILIVIGSRHQRKQLLIEKKSFDDLSDNLSTYLIETTRANVTKEEMFPWSMIYKKSSHSSSWPYPAITRSGVAITHANYHGLIIFLAFPKKNSHTPFSIDSRGRH